MTLWQANVALSPAAAMRAPGCPQFDGQAYRIDQSVAVQSASAHRCRESRFGRPQLLCGFPDSNRRSEIFYSGAD